MKKISGIVLLLMAFLQAKAQVAVSMDKVNVTYELVENPLVVAVEHCSCNDIRLAVDMGTISKGDEPCAFLYTAPNAGKATFTVSRKIGKEYKEAGKMVYRVKPLPPPEAFLGGKRDADMYVPVFKTQLGLTAVLIDFAFDIHYTISEFRMEIKRRQQVIFEEDNKGNVFNNEIKVFRDKVLSGDIVTFRNIRCRRPDGKIIALASFEIRLK